MLTLPAFELTQMDKKIYLSHATAQQISQWLAGTSASMQADIWDKETNPEGYQRKPDLEKIRNIEEYLRSKRGVDPLMPASIVLNLRAQRIKFNPKDQQSRFGTLRIEDEAGALWEVDGQHRLRGLAKAILDAPSPVAAKLRSYSVPLTIIVSLTKPDEALQFVAINTTQTKVKPELALRILWKRYQEKAEAAERFLKGQTWKIRAVDIVDALNRDQTSPFFDAIASPGGSRKGKLITEGMFVSSLEPLTRFQNKFLNENFLRTFWNSIAAVFPNACATNKRMSYGLLRNVGPYVFHKLAPLLALWTAEQEGSMDAEQLTVTIQAIKKHSPESFWLRQGGRVSDYSSRGGYNRLATQITYKLLKLSDPQIPPDVPKLQAASKTLLTLHLLREYTKDNVKMLTPAGPGTYIWFRFRDNAVYVGMDEISIRRRLLEHASHQPNLFGFKPLGEIRASELERYLWHSLIGASGWKLINATHPASHGGRRCPVCRKRRV